jgi:hypothetical protein
MFAILAGGWGHAVGLTTARSASAPSLEIENKQY